MSVLKTSSGRGGKAYARKVDMYLKPFCEGGERQPRGRGARRGDARTHITDGGPDSKPVVGELDAERARVGRGVLHRARRRFVSFAATVREADGRFERPGGVQVEGQKGRGRVDGRGRAFVGRRRGGGSGGNGVRRAKEALESELDFVAVAEVAGRRTADAVADDTDPGAPNVVTDSDVELEDAEEVNLELVDVLERDPRHGGERLVAVRVVLERLKIQAMSSGKLAKAEIK